MTIELVFGVIIAVLAIVSVVVSAAVGYQIFKLNHVSKKDREDYKRFVKDLDARHAHG